MSWRRLSLSTSVWLLAAAVACGPSSVRHDGGSGGKAGTSGTGGVGTPDGGTEGGTGGLAPACVDIVITPENLGESSTDWGIIPVSGGPWRTSSGLHVGWMASVASMEDGGRVARAWIFIATFNPMNGALLRLRKYDVFPPGSDLTKGSCNVTAIGGSEGEVFAVALRSFDVVARQPRNQTLFLGRLDDDGYRQETDLGWKSDLEDVTDVGWDGEAFAVHARRNDTGEVFVTRVGPSGELVRPSTKFTVTPSPGREYRMSTNAVSGMSYLFDASSTGHGRYLSGHDRSGTQISWAPGMPLNVVIPGLVGANDPGTYPAVVSDSLGGAWIAWTQGALNGGNIRAAAHVTRDGNVDRSFAFSYRSGFRSPGLGSRATSSMWIADPDGMSITLAEVVDNVATPPRLLVSGPFASTDTVHVWSTDEMSALDWNGERWLSFVEQSSLLHIVKVDANCTYQAAYKPPG